MPEGRTNLGGHAVAKEDGRPGEIEAQLGHVENERGQRPSIQAPPEDEHQDGGDAHEQVQNGPRQGEGPPRRRPRRLTIRLDSGQLDPNLDLHGQREREPEQSRSRCTGWPSWRPQ